MHTSGTHSYEHTCTVINSNSCIIIVPVAKTVKTIPGCAVSKEQAEYDFSCKSSLQSGNVLDIELCKSSPESINSFVIEKFYCSYVCTCMPTL